MIFALIASSAFAGDYDISLRIEDRRGRLVVEQTRFISDDVPRAIPFLWGRAPAAALVTTNADKVCFWLVDEDGAPLRILGTGGCSTLGDTSEASTEIDAPEGRVVLRIRASTMGAPGVLAPDGSFTPPPVAR